MIPKDFITEWREQAPWITDAQVEQDLVISRALVEIFRVPELPIDRAVDMVDPLALTLLDATTLDVFQRALTAPSSDLQDRVGLRTEALHPRFGAGSCPVDCGTPDGTMKCCCGIGQRCELRATYCRCVPATFSPTTAVLAR